MARWGSPWQEDACLARGWRASGPWFQGGHRSRTIQKETRVASLAPAAVGHPDIHPALGESERGQCASAQSSGPRPADGASAAGRGRQRRAPGVVLAAPEAVRDLPPLCSAPAGRGAHPLCSALSLLTNPHLQDRWRPVGESRVSQRPGGVIPGSQRVVGREGSEPGERGCGACGGLERGGLGPTLPPAGSVTVPVVTPVSWGAHRCGLRPPHPGCWLLREPVSDP